MGPEGVLDQRGWEMVSPVDMNGGQVEAPGAPGAGVVQASMVGGAIAFGSAASFGLAEGAAPVSQYTASRGTAGWGTGNITPPLISSTYAGGAYQLISSQLSRAVLSNGWACRDGGEGCPAENPPLGQGAPAGYRNLYLREGGQYKPLITTVNAPALSISPEAFELSLAGAAPDLGQVILSSCAALTADAIEVPAGAGCDAASTNLYEASIDGSLKAVNILPGQGGSAPGAALAAPAGAVSADGARVYWQGADGNLYLRKDGTQTVQVDSAAEVGGGGTFQTASSDGSVALFTKAGHLYRFTVAGEETTDLTPGGEVQGVLGTSADASYVYYLATSGLYLSKGAGAPTKIAAGADLSNLPAATGTARVTPDGTRLAFVSSAPLTNFPNNGKAEVFIYEAPEKRLLCASCNVRGKVAVGSSTIPGALAAGGGPATYKPRSLTADGSRIFFDSADALVAQDSDNAPDVYEWQARNAGGCTKASGCIGLISSGRNGKASFLDASADGTDVFFLTDASLLPQDTGSVDVYDARAGGGFPEPEPEIPCNGDDCQGPAPAPEVGVPGTAVLVGPPNPPLSFKKQKHKKGKKGKKKHHKKRHQKQAHHKGRSAR
jgi:hypothetical protein